MLSAAITDPQLAADQQAVLAAQQQVDAALAAAATALANETSVCAAFTAPAPAGTTDPGTTASPPPDVSACQQAITAVGDAQNAVDAAQKTLATASSTLDARLGQIAVTPPTAPPTTTPPTTAPAPATPSSRGGGTGSQSGSAAAGPARVRARVRARAGAGSSRTGGTGSSTSPSAADLVAYQSEVDAASAAVAMAQQSLDQATISSPLAGTVVAVNMKIGDQVTAASSTENIVVQGAGGYEVTTSVSVDEIPSISVGQAASVVPDGTHTATERQGRRHLGGARVGFDDEHPLPRDDRAHQPGREAPQRCHRHRLDRHRPGERRARGALVCRHDGRHAPLREPHVSRVRDPRPGTSRRGRHDVDRDHERPAQGTAGGARRRVGAPPELGDRVGRRDRRHRHHGWRRTLRRLRRRRLRRRRLGGGGGGTGRTNRTG